MTSDDSLTITATTTTTAADRRRASRDAMLSVRMPTATLDALRAAADSDGRSASAMALRYIERGLDTATGGAR